MDSSGLPTVQEVIQFLKFLSTYPLAWVVIAAFLFLVASKGIAMIRAAGKEKT